MGEDRLGHLEVERKAAIDLIFNYEWINPTPVKSRRPEVVWVFPQSQNSGCSGEDVSGSYSRFVGSFYDVKATHTSTPISAERRQVDRWAQREGGVWKEDDITPQFAKGLCFNTPPSSIFEREIGPKQPTDILRAPSYSEEYMSEVGLGDDRESRFRRRK